MSKHYYAGLYNRHGQLCELVCYHSDNYSDEEVKAAYEEETAPYFWASSQYVLRKIPTRKLAEAKRDMFGTFNHRNHRILFNCTTSSSAYVFANAASLYRFW